MHLHREQLLAISQNIYAHKLFVANVQHQRYQEYLDKALRERIKSNSEFFSGQLSDGSRIGPDGFQRSRSIGGSDFGGDGESVEMRRIADTELAFGKDNQKETKMKKKRTKKVLEEAKPEPAIKIMLEVPEAARSKSVQARPTKRLSYNKTGCDREDGFSEAKALLRVRPQLISRQVVSGKLLNEAN